MCRLCVSHTKGTFTQLFKVLIQYLLIIEYTWSWQLFWTVPRDENWLTGLSDFSLAACEHAFPPFLVLRVWPTVADFPTAPKAIKSTSDWSGMEISFFYDTHVWFGQDVTPHAFYDATVPACTRSALPFPLLRKRPDYSLDSRLIQHSRHRDAVEALHGGHGRLHGLLLPQVWCPNVVRQQVAVVLQPRLRETRTEEVGYTGLTC